jgi:hypothetical protein
MRQFFKRRSRGINSPHPHGQDCLLAILKAPFGFNIVGLHLTKEIVCSKPDWSGMAPTREAQR